MILQERNIKIQNSYIQIKLIPTNLRVYNEKGILSEVLSFMDTQSMFKHLLGLFLKSEIMIENKVRYILECLRVNRDIGASEYALEEIIYKVIEQTRDEQTSRNLQ